MQLSAGKFTQGTVCYIIPQGIATSHPRKIANILGLVTPLFTTWILNIWFHPLRICLIKSFYIASSILLQVDKDSILCLDAPISPEKLNSTISSVKPIKSPDPIGLTTPLLAHSPQFLNPTFPLFCRFPKCTHYSYLYGRWRSFLMHKLPTHFSTQYRSEAPHKK